MSAEGQGELLRGWFAGSFAIHRCASQVHGFWPNAGDICAHANAIAPILSGGTTPFTAEGRSPHENPIDKECHAGGELKSVVVDQVGAFVLNA